MRGLLFACLLLAGCAPTATAAAPAATERATTTPLVCAGRCADLPTCPTATQPNPATCLVRESLPQPTAGLQGQQQYATGTATPQTRAGDGFYEGPAIVRGHEYTDCAVRLPCVSFLYLQPTANVILTDASGRSYGRVNPGTRIVGVTSSDRNLYLDLRLPHSSNNWLGIPVYVVLTEDGEPSEHQGMVMYWLTSIVCLTDCVK